jgi:hypothetical protein
MPGGPPEGSDALRMERLKRLALAERTVLCASTENGQHWDVPTPLTPDAAWWDAR